MLPLRLKKRNTKMPVIYKVDVVAKLKAAGYSSYRIRKDKIFGEAVLQRLRNGESVSWENIATICKLLQCQPGDILGYAPDDDTSSAE